MYYDCFIFIIFAMITLEYTLREHENRNTACDAGVGKYIG